MKMFYEKDTDVNLIKDKKIAIFGYGSQGHAHALNLKDCGVKEVVVALRDGSASIPKAESKGLKVMNLSDAAEWADVVMILTPDELQASIYKNHIEQRVKEVVVALREGSSSIAKAESKGLKVMNLSDAAAWADVVMILTPDELQAEIYKNHIEQRVREGTSIAFAHGLNVHYDLIKARKDLDVFMVCLLYTSPSPRDGLLSRMPSSA